LVFVSQQKTSHDGHFSPYSHLLSASVSWHLHSVVLIFGTADYEIDSAYYSTHYMMSLNHSYSIAVTLYMCMSQELDVGISVFRKSLNPHWFNIVTFSVQYLLLQVMMCSCTVLQLQCVDKDKSGRFVLHCLQLRPNMVCKTLECHKMVNVSSQSEVVQGFPVRVRILTVLVFVFLTGYVCL
jgi:hypothetical protein